MYITFKRERKLLRGTGTRQRVFGEVMMYSAHRRGEEPEEQEQDEVGSWSLWSALHTVRVKRNRYKT